MKKVFPLEPSFQNFYVPPLTRRTKDEQHFHYPTAPQGAARKFFERDLEGKLFSKKFSLNFASKKRIRFNACGIESWVRENKSIKGF